MDKNKKIGLLTKFMSNRHYLTEVPIEGKKSVKFNFSLGYYDRYVAQIIRAGNCITLLSTIYAINEESFWITTLFEDFTKYLFWTFNKSFLLKLMDGIETKKLSVLQRCRELLIEHPVAYTEPTPDDADEELRFCYMKNSNLKKDRKFAKMYLLDEQNRAAFLSAVEKRIAEFPHPVSGPKEEQLTIRNADLHEAPGKDFSRSLLFLEVLAPMEGGAESTIQFIKAKIEEAGFDFKIFSSVTRLPNGKNPYGLNGCIAAMIDFFYQHHYFKREYGLEEIFKAYLEYSGNTIGKLHTFLSDFRDDKSYRKHFGKLKALKINKLS